MPEYMLAQMAAFAAEAEADVLFEVNEEAFEPTFEREPVPQLTAEELAQLFSRGLL